MKKQILFILSIVFIGISPSCIRHDIEGNMQFISENRNISNFDEIKSEGNFNISFIQSNQTDLIIEGESNILPYVQTIVEGNTLVIKNRDHRNFDNNLPINIFVYAPSCSSLVMTGSGNISSDSISANSMNLKLSGSGNINCRLFTDYLKANISGSGDIDIEGENSESDYQISGSGTIHSYNLMQNSCYATISGSGCIFVTAIDILDVKISGSGRVYYKGNPVINSHITGSIINKNN